MNERTECLRQCSSLIQRQVVSSGSSDDQNWSYWTITQSPQKQEYELRTLSSQLNPNIYHRKASTRKSTRAIAAPRGGRQGKEKGEQGWTLSSQERCLLHLELPYWYCQAPLLPPTVLGKWFTRDVVISRDRGAISSPVACTIALLFSFTVNKI